MEISTFQKIRLAILGLLLLAVLAFYLAVQFGVQLSDFDAVDNMRAEWMSPDSQHATVLDVNPQDMRVAMKNSYRLSPDKRFLLALNEVATIMSGKPPRQVKTVIEGDQWLVSFEDAKVGSLPDLPEFEDCHRLLRQWARTIADRYPVEHGHAGAASQDGIPSMLDIEGTLAALERLSRNWKPGSAQPEQLLLAARLYCNLIFHHIDYMGVSDRLSTSAWAVLALAEELNGIELVRERALLAYGLGYHNSAWELADQLPANNPIRAFIQADDATLENLAKQSQASIDVKYLWLKRLAINRDDTAWHQWYANHFSRTAYMLPVLASALEMGSFRSQEYFSTLMTQMAFVFLAQDATGNPDILKAAIYIKENPEKVDGAIKGALQLLTGMPSAEFIPELFYQLLPYSSGGLIDEFEAVLVHAANQRDGAILGKKEYQALFRGYFYSGIYSLSEFFMDRLSSESSTKLLAMFVGSEGKGEVAKQVGRWCKSLATSESVVTGESWMQNEFSSMNLLGGKAANRLLQAVIAQSNWAGPGLMRSIRTFAGRLDSRYEDRFILLRLSHQYLHDVPLTVYLAKSIVDRSPRATRGVFEWYALFTRDRESLQELVASVDAAPSGQVRALEFLGQMEQPDIQFIDDGYKRLILKWPALWRANESYISFLSDHGRHREAIEVISNWLLKHKDFNGFHKIRAKVLLATNYEKLGDIKKALAISVPLAEQTYQVGAFSTAVHQLAVAGDFEAAERLALLAYQRYSNNFPTMIDLVKLYWEHEEYKKAADILGGFKQRIDGISWRFKVGYGFADIFKDRAVEDAEQAFNALLKTGLGHFDLYHIPLSMRDHDRPDQAFALHTKLRWEGIGNMVFQVQAYRNLADMKGKPEALAWLNKQIPPNMRNAASMIIFKAKAYELLWDLIPDPAAGQHSDFVWLMRACAYIAGAKLSDAQLKELLAYYDSIGSKSYYDRIGLYLLGKTDEKELLKLVKSPNQRCEIAYYMGFRALAGGQLELASDWFRVSVETGQEGMGEYRWSSEELYRFYTQEKDHLIY